MSFACAPGSLERGADGPVRGSFVPSSAASWPERALRPLGESGGSSERVGQVLVLEATEEMVSGIDGRLGLRFDEERNDLAAVSRAALEAIGDGPGLLAVFTSFEDLGTGGEAYFVPFWSGTRGTGMESFDQRETFGALHSEGLVNMKRPRTDDLAERTALLAHEAAHRHLAYLSARTESATAAMELTGRQGAHWHALLHSGASLLEGHAFAELTSGVFVVRDARSRLGDLDLYGLGLLRPEEVQDFFFVEGGRTEGGAAIPSGARLPIGSRVLGRRLSLTIGDVIRAVGERAPESGPLRLRFVLVTEPGLAASSTVAERLALDVDRIREAFVLRWAELTGGRQRAETVLEPSSSAADGGYDDGGGLDGGATEDGDGSCGCRHVRKPRSRSPSSLFASLLVGLGAHALCRRARPANENVGRLRRRRRGPSSDHSPRRGRRPCREDHRLRR